MEINWFGLVIGILITCLSYMLIPVILKLKNGQKKKILTYQLITLQQQNYFCLNGLIMINMT